jgi:hypothetical protein
VEKGGTGAVLVAPKIMAPQKCLRLLQGSPWRGALQKRHHQSGKVPFLALPLLRRETIVISVVVLIVQVVQGGFRKLMMHAVHTVCSE